MYPYHPSYLFMLFYQPIRKSLVAMSGFYVPTVEVQNADMIVPISQPCFQMVADVKFHPVVMVLDLIPVQLPDPGLLLVVVL
jgi:hypothetical protein